MWDATVSMITSNRIAFVNTAVYRDMPARPTDAMPIWAFES
jgi:hypothetical protein